MPCEVKPWDRDPLSRCCSRGFPAVMRERHFKNAERGKRSAPKISPSLFFLYSTNTSHSAARRKPRHCRTKQLKHAKATFIFFHPSSAPPKVSALVSQTTCEHLRDNNGEVFITCFKGTDCAGESPAFQSAKVVEV